MTAKPLIAAACVATAGLLAVGGCASTSSLTGSGSSPAVPSYQQVGSGSVAAPASTAAATSAAPNTDAGRAAQARTLAGDLVNLVKLPSGAQVQDAAPPSPIAQPLSAPGSDNLVDVSRWWLVPGTVDDVLAYVKAHPPGGMTNSGSGSGGGPGGVYVTEVGYDIGLVGVYDRGLEIAATAYDGSVAVRADGQVVWLPVRTAAEYVPLDVSGATVVRQTAGSGSQTKVVDVATARRLAAMLDALQTAEPGNNPGGPMISTIAKVTFAGAPATFTVDQCCRISVTVNGAAQPGLSDDGSVQTAVDAIFGVVDSPPVSVIAPSPAGPPASGVVPSPVVSSVPPPTPLATASLSPCPSLERNLPDAANDVGPAHPCPLAKPEGTAG